MGEGSRFTWGPLHSMGLAEGRAGEGDGRKRIPTPPSGLRCRPLADHRGPTPALPFLWDHGQVSASVSTCVELLSYTTHCHTLRRVPGTQEMLHKFYYLRGASLMAQWLRIHLPKWETWVRSLMPEDPTG